MKKSLKRGIAFLLAVLMMIPTSSVSVKAEEGEEMSSDLVIVTTGSGENYHEIAVRTSDCAYDWDANPNCLVPNENVVFADDGSYTIQVEEGTVFPYAVYFNTLDSYRDEANTTLHSYEALDESFTFAGHNFILASSGTDSQTDAGTDASTPSVGSMLPLEEKTGTLDLSDMAPIELSHVSVADILTKLVGDDTTVLTALGVTSTSELSIMVKRLYDSGADQYKVASSDGYINLSTLVTSSSQTLEIIVGKVDQLETTNIRYRVSVKGPSNSDWLVPTVYQQAEDGTRTSMTVVDNDNYDTYYYSSSSGNRMYIYVKGSEWGYDSDGNLRDYGYVSLKLADTYSDLCLKAYAGTYDTADAAMQGTDITSQLFASDMTQLNAGYQVERYTNTPITLVNFDASGNAIGCLTFKLYLYTTGVSFNFSGLYNESGNNIISRGNSSYSDGVYTYTYEMARSGKYAANTFCYFRPKCYVDGEQKDFTAVYLGTYNSIAAAAADGAADVTSAFNGTQGYGADYSQGVNFTFFVGEDGSEDQRIYKYCIKTEEYTSSSTTSTSTASASVGVTFKSFKEADGTTIEAYQVKAEDDSYGDYNYITILVDQNVTDEELKYLAPVFNLTDSAEKLYAAGSSTAEISGESYHDFSNGPLQFTTSAEDGTNSKNYWVQVLRAENGAGTLAFSSMNDESANTRTENGVVYTTREMMIDSYHSNKHDIILINMGTEAISGLTVELQSDTVALDEYWTLTGNNALSGFVDLDGKTVSGSTARDGELWNMAKLRLVKKTGVEDGTDISGTLTIKSGDTTLMVMTLTGTVGDPSFTTKELPAAVKYVPYGTMIQNSNKYSWNTVTYSFVDGELPGGMTLKANGEIYGVPTETGEFTFTVRLKNSSSNFSSVEKTFTLVVKENTDANVEGETDDGYALLDRVPDLDSDADGTYVMRSEGTLSTFQDIYLDGVKLVEGTDYTKSEGSTRITIEAQTLTASGVDGAHTLGMEFRESASGSSEGTLKKAAQNYYLNGGRSDSSDDSSSSSDSGSSDDDDDSSSSSSGSSQTTAAVTKSYVVVKGDTLNKIAAANGMTLAALLNLNPQIKNPNLIYPGQVVYLSVASAGEVGTAASGANGSYVYYTVVKGDCMYKIAHKYGLKLSQLTAMNPDIAGQKYIFAGQKVRVQ